MSQIDTYKNRLLGFIECPSVYNFIYNNVTRRIAIYQIVEVIAENDFDAKRGDIVIGGGTGEAPAIRISLPEYFHFVSNEGCDDYSVRKDIVKCFWSPTQSYILGDGFAKLGWSPGISIEFWLSEQVILLLIDNYPEFSFFDKNLYLINRKLQFIKN